LLNFFYIFLKEKEATLCFPRAIQKSQNYQLDAWERKRGYRQFEVRQLAVKIDIFSILFIKKVAVEAII